MKKISRKMLIGRYNNDGQYFIKKLIILQYFEGFFSLPEHVGGYRKSSYVEVCR